MSEPDAACSSATAAKEEKEKKIFKPKGGKFYQQRLLAVRPNYTAKNVLPVLLAVGVSFVIIGVFLLKASDEIYEKSIDYTNCTSLANSTQKCRDVLDWQIMHNEKDEIPLCKCIINFAIERNITESEVYFYYGLTNFFQNRLHYVKSRNDRQLLGELSEVDGCEPWNVYNKTFRKKYAPCGSIANSMFNDSYKLYDEQGLQIPWTNKGLVPHDNYKDKFKNPGQTNDYYPTLQNLTESFKGFLRPRDWVKEIYELDLEDDTNNGFLNSDFIIWMHPAALPNFTKLYRKVNNTEGLITAQNYTLHIDYVYPVAIFNGTKRFVISNSLNAGIKNKFLAIAYICLGSLCLVLSLFFLIIHIKFRNT